ncbi:MAG: hypothetical protein NTY48_03550 [Candidatus Diapherotrites archaeon]|nr:hypothetical protein [Candidatus Diapherotrites archaeon]
MKLKGWIILAISILIVAAATIVIDKWASEWKNLFFYMDDWRMWIILFVFIYLVKKILEKLLIVEARILK